MRFLPRRRGFRIALVLLLGVGVFATVSTAFGVSVGEEFKNAIINLLGQLIIGVDKLLAALLVVITRIMVAAAQYNDFTTAPAVVKGWTIVRDLSNMFFIVILLVISFGTVLRIQQYRFQQTLPRFIIWAVLINFSKFIAGVWIDFAQVITLTFVNAFRAAAEGNIVSAFGLQDMLSYINTPTTTVGFGDIFAALVLSLALLIIANVVILSITVVFMFRIVALWILVVLSPIAYLTRTFPNAVKYSDQWWTTFNKYVLVGPVMAFFIWLALTITATKGPDTIASGLISDEEAIPVIGQGVGSIPANALAASISTISRSDRLLSFLLSISLFVSALIATQQLGVMGTSVTKGALQGIQRNSLRAARFLSGASAASKIPTLLDYGARKLYAGKVPGLAVMKGIDLNMARNYRRWQEHREVKKHQELEAGEEAAGERLKAGGAKGFVGGFSAGEWVDYIGLGGYERVMGRFRGGIGRAEKVREKAHEIEDEATLLEVRRQYGDPTSAYETYLEDQEKTLWAEGKKTNEYLKHGETIDQEIATLQATKAKNPEEEESNRIQIQDLQAERKAWEAEMAGDTGAQLREKQQRIMQDITALQGQREAYNQKDADGKFQQALDHLKAQLEKKKDEKKRVENGGASEAMIAARDAERHSIHQDLEVLHRDLVREQDLLAKTKDPAQLAARQGRVNELQEKERKFKDRLELLKNNEKRTQEEDAAYQKNKKSILDGLQHTINTLTAATTTINGKERTTVMSVGERRQLEERITALRGKAKDQRQLAEAILSKTPEPYEARAAGRNAANAELKNVKTTNEDELIRLFKNALSEKNEARARAVVLQAANVGHLNELVNAEGYTANQEGLSQFIRKTFMERLGMDEQTALSIQNDISDAAQAINHWTFAQSVGLKDGHFYARSSEEQGHRAIVEMFKADPENVLRRGNRLAYGGEDAEGNFHLGPMGAVLLAKNYAVIPKQFDRARYNKNAAERLVSSTALADMEKLIRSGIVEDELAFRGFIAKLKGYAKGTADQIKDEASIAAKLFT